ncbi:prolyl 4-hydroxylase subunit alpha-1-like [Clytia hemisphaerica]|uniref:prolyl 4-hydroxylase subunit alpha-1-like n=1 Tax=Clytia hemisphaerica TaxID=252671 RepID=UPI0034D6DABF
MWKSLALVLVVLCILEQGQCEVFTSMANMENLAETEQLLFSSFKTYLQAEEDRLKVLKNFMLRVEDAQKNVNLSDVAKYLGNPINTYLMLRRLSSEWRDVESFLSQDGEAAEDFKAIYDNAKMVLPTTEDHEGAMTALFRLQDTYKVPSNMLAKGIIPGVKSLSHHLEIREIYEIGLHAYDNQNYQYASEWMRTAYEEFGLNATIDGIKRNKVLDYLAYSEYKKGNLPEAFKLTKELAALR